MKDLAVDQIPGTFPEKPTRAVRYLAERLKKKRVPVLTRYDVFMSVREVYAEAPGQKLYLRSVEPTEKDYSRLRQGLLSLGKCRLDPDYGSRVLRVVDVPDLPADEVVCIVDRLCYVSHLSAMLRWGLTDRQSEALHITRPARARAHKMLEELMRREGAETFPAQCKLVSPSHPEVVRRRRIQVFETRNIGESIKVRGGETRISTIGQTFLDTLHRPDLCGGMSHVLDVWEQHAKTYLDEIITAVSLDENSLVKCRAGYILDERLAVRDARIWAWRAFAQRGGSRKLDPQAEYISNYSEKWMISINV